MSTIRPKFGVHPGNPGITKSSQSGGIMNKWRDVAFALLCGLLALTTARAQVYPNRSVKVIVPVTPGSPTDAAARVLAQHLQIRLGQSVIVENHSGGGTSIGARMVASAAPDGYTLLFMGPNMAFYPVVYPNLDFDPLKRLLPVASAVTWNHVLVVAPKVPAKSVGELVAYAKANPGKLVFGYGLGTPPHMLGEASKRAAGIDVAGIPYRGGEQARTDLLGGRVDINFAPIANMLSLVQDGRVRPLAFTGAQRSSDLPDVPTMIENGLPEVGFYPDYWLGIFAPAGTPAALVDQLNREINEVLRVPEVKATFAQQSSELKISTPKEFGSFFAAELKKWPPLLRAAGVMAE